MMYETNYPAFALDARGALIADVALPCYTLEPENAGRFMRDEDDVRSLVEDDIRRALLAPGWGDVQAVTVYHALTGEALRTYTRRELRA